MILKFIPFVFKELEQNSKMKTMCDASMYINSHIKKMTLETLNLIFIFKINFFKTYFLLVLPLKFNQGQLRVRCKQLNGYNYHTYLTNLSDLSIYD